MGKNEETTKNVNKHTGAPKKCEEEEDVNALWNGHAFVGFYLPKKSKYVFQNLMASQIRI